MKLSVTHLNGSNGYPFSNSTGDAGTVLCSPDRATEIPTRTMQLFQDYRPQTWLRLCQTWGLLPSQAMYPPRTMQPHQVHGPQPSQGYVPSQDYVASPGLCSPTRTMQLCQSYGPLTVGSIALPGPCTLPQLCNPTSTTWPWQGFGPLRSGRGP